MTPAFFNIALLILLLILLCFAAGSLLGAPYLPTKRREVQTALKLLNLKPGQTVLDLGCGDGTFLKAAAKSGLYAVGYEINPIMWLAAKMNTREYRDRVQVKLGNYWKAKLPEADGIYVFLITRYMSKLDQKVKSEAKKPVKLASYTFEIPEKQPVKEATGVYLYTYK